MTIQAQRAMLTQEGLGAKGIAVEEGVPLERPWRRPRWELR